VGVPGKESFRRLMALIKEGGGNPIHTYNIQ
jgi:hypothetical protein